MKLIIKRIKKADLPTPPLNIKIEKDPSATPVAIDLTSRKAIAYRYYGLKINEDTLTAKKTTLMEVIALLGLKEYVIGRDEALSATKKSHYHIHFRDDRTLDALQKYKQRVMPEWGRTTKLYPPKDRVDNIMCWYGYACKEKLIHATETIDPVALAQEAHTQHAYKQSQLNYGKQQEEKKAQKKDLETTIFTQIDDLPLTHKDFFEVAEWVHKFFFTEMKTCPSHSQIEKYTWDYLLSREYATHKDRIFWLFKNKI